MAKKQPLSRRPSHSASSGRSAPGGYGEILTELTQAIAESRHRALATVNRELVCLYWYIGRTIVQQQETAQWGEAIVEQLATDLRAETQTWHFTHPSANSNCDPQSGQVPINASPALAADSNIPTCSIPPTEFRIITGTPCPTLPLALGAVTAGVSADEANSSCCTPFLARSHSSIASPTASGIDSTLFGPSPTARSDDMPRNCR